eukprot:symbB.v1.2.013255.t1/scaffold879.1/size325971/2
MHEETRSWSFFAAPSPASFSQPWFKGSLVSVQGFSVVTPLMQNVSASSVSSKQILSQENHIHRSSYCPFGWVQLAQTLAYRMLMPFFLLGAINSVVDGAALLQMFTTYGWNTFAFVPVDILLCIFLCELISSIASWRIIKMVLPMGQFENGYQELPGGPGVAGARPLGGPGPGGVSNPNPGTRSADFRPFQGTGHKLGG